MEGNTFIHKTNYLSIMGCSKKKKLSIMGTMHLSDSSGNIYSWKIHYTKQIIKDKTIIRKLTHLVYDN
jgi:hypothetical protein